MSTECTTADCQNWTSTYLCTQCVSDMQSWLDKVSELLPELDVTIARLDVVRRSSEGGHSKTTGSAAPINLDALQIKANLQSLGTDANYYAGDQFAAGIASTIQDWVTKAEVIISGPEEVFAYGKCSNGDCTATITGPPAASSAQCRECGTVHNLTERAERMRANAKGEPLAPREAIDYIRDKTRLKIKMDDFKNWVKHGHLTYVLDRVTSDDKPRRIYYPGEVFKIAQQMRERRIKV